MQVKDQMLAMQEDMLNQLNAEIEKLKLMLLAKQQAEATQIHASGEREARGTTSEDQQFRSDNTMRMAGTAKA